MTKKAKPKLLWDFGIVYEVELLSIIRKVKYNRTGYEEVTSQITDIGEYLYFEFYNLVWFCYLPDKPNNTDNPRKLACWLGIYHIVESEMCYWLMTETGELVSRILVEHITRDDNLNPYINSSIDDFNKKLIERLDDGNFPCKFRC